MFGYGDGGNGKGVLLEMVTGILGEYAITASMDVFTADGNGSWASHRRRTR